MQEDEITIKKGISSVTAHRFGATLISWKPKGSEVLFVSEKSHFDHVKPIRGGIPIVFPHFGPWEIGPQHGFARKMLWAVAKKEDKIIFNLQDTDESRSIWNYKFNIEYVIKLMSDSELEKTAVITNTDDKPFDFTFLFHTYFTVTDIDKCTVSDLSKCHYIDKVDGGTDKIEESNNLHVPTNTDRIYMNTPDVHYISEVTSSHSKIGVKKVNLPDTVIWNPGPENSKKMSDFGDDEYKRMLCVEAGHVSKPVTLEPGQKFEASQILFVNCLNNN